MSVVSGLNYRFSVKGAWWHPMLTDDPSSTTGPTYSAGIKIPGIQTLSLTDVASQEKLPGDDTIIGVESSDDVIDINCEFGQQSQLLLAAIRGGEQIIAGSVASFYSYAADSTIYGKMVALVTKIGKPGQDLLITIYKLNAGSIEFGAEHWKFGKNSFKAMGLAIESSILVGSTQRNLRFQIDERGTAAGYDPGVDTTPPTVSSTAPTDAQSLAAPASVIWTMSKAMDPNYLTGDYVYVMTVAGAAKAGAAVAVGSTVVFTPTTVFAGGTDYIAVMSTGVRDLAGNRLAARSVVNFTTT